MDHEISAHIVVNASMIDKKDKEEKSLEWTYHFGNYDMNQYGNIVLKKVSFTSGDGNVKNDRE
jgi:hypothetical protein